MILFPAMNDAVGTKINSNGLRLIGRDRGGSA